MSEAEEAAVRVVAAMMTLVVFVALSMLIVFGVWHLWLWATPQVWPEAPERFAAPSYWLFLAVWLLISIFGLLLFGGRWS